MWTFNEQLPYLDLITEFENGEAGIETTVVPVKNSPRPALRENPAEFQTIALPVIMRAKSIRIKPSDNNKKAEVGVVDSAANSNGNAEPSTKEKSVAVPIRDEYSTAAKPSAAKPRRTLARLRDITAIIYSLMSWTRLILSIRAIRK